MNNFNEVIETLKVEYSQGIKEAKDKIEKLFSMEEIDIELVNLYNCKIFLYERYLDDLK